MTMRRALARAFAEAFQRWSLELPADSLDRDEPGSIVKAGWVVNYRFVKGDGAEVLEFFASHRMTNDTLNEIGPDGRRRVIDACREFYVAGDPEAEARYREHNRRFYSAVAERGLLERQATAGAVNAALRMGLIDSTEGDD
jgi:hypothetical protein